MNNGSEEASQFANNPETIENNEKRKQESPVIENEDLQYAEEVVPSNSIPEQDNEGVSPRPHMNVRPSNVPDRSTIASVNSIKHRSARRVINSIGNQDLQPVSAQIDPPAISLTRENDYAQASPEMKNPIKPITSRLGKTLKTDVDFKTGKAANNTGAGFFLKIGKFEISRKKGKKKKR